jgi:hypothetical protein
MIKTLLVVFRHRGQCRMVTAMVTMPVSWLGYGYGINQTLTFDD